jgi:hypothetical protein
VFDYIVFNAKNKGINMKQLFVILQILFIIIISCGKDEINYGYAPKIEITGVSSDTVRQSDTLMVYIDWMDSPKSENLEATIGKEQADVIGLKNDTTAMVIVPGGDWGLWENGIIQIVHPNGAYSLWNGLVRKIHPLVYSVNPTQGKANDIITIKGKDFSSLTDMKISINTLKAEIIEFTDVLVKVKVPVGSGNGPIKILYGMMDYSSCQPIKVEIGQFTYNFQTGTPKKVRRYTDYGNNYSLEKDAFGKVVKRIHMDDNWIPTNVYDVFVYDIGGMLDTMISYTNQGVNTFTVYSRNQDNSIIETTKYYNDILSEKYEYHYLNEQLVQLNYYDSDGILEFSNQYTYDGNKQHLTRNFYNKETGQVGRIQEYDAEYDLQNGILPDIGIPGYPYFNKYPYTSFDSSQDELVYDDFGNLVISNRYYCNFDFSQVLL